MIKFFKNISIFGSITVIIYLLLFYVVDNGLKKSNHLEYEQWNAIYNGNINSDIIIQGSSRAWRQINPKIIENNTNLTCYNLGMDGYHFPMQKCRFDIYKNYNKKPKYLIQILDHFTLKQRENLFNKTQFIPYLDDTLLANHIKNYEGFSWAEYNLPYFSYFGCKELAAAGFLEYFNLKEFNSPKYNGFKSKDASWDFSFEREKESNKAGKRVDFNFNVATQLNTFVRQAKSENIEVIFVYTPDYIEFQEYTTNRDSIIDIYEYIALHNDITFINFSSDTSICNHKSYFYNPTHLNTKGANLVTDKLNQKLLELYNF